MLPRRSLLLSFNLALGILALGAAPGSANTIYRWVDAKGVVHYSDQMPAGMPAEQVHIRSHSPSSDGGAASSSPAAQASEPTPPVSEPQSRNLSQPSPQPDPALCEQARRDLTVIHENARIMIEENGTQRYLTPEEREKHKARLERIMREACGPQRQK